MGQCSNENIGTKCDNKNQIEKVKELRKNLSENNKMKIIGGEDNNIQIEKNEETNLLINNEKEKTKEEIKKEKEERKKLERIEELQRKWKSITKQAHLFFDGKLNNIYQKLTFANEVSNYIKENIYDMENNSINDLISPQKAIIDQNYIIRFLGYLGDELSEYRIKTYIETKTSNEFLRDITFKLILSGLATQRIYKIVINSTINKNLFKQSIDNWHKYNQRIRDKLIENKNITVYNSEVYFFNFDNNNFEVYMVIYNKRLNGVEDILESSFDIKVIRRNLVDYIILSPDMFMIQYCKNVNEWPKDNDKLFRGGERYHPPRGWIGLALKLKNKFGYNSEWLGNTGRNDKEWCVAFHGIRKGKGDVFKKVLNILNGNLMQGPKQCFSGYPNRRSHTVAKYKNIGEGVYLTPDIEKAEVYADKIILGRSKKDFQFAIMARVNPRKIRDPGLLPINWVLNGSNDEIRPYRLLVKIS